ncbi:MAG: hypothetical protein H7Y60_08080 [Rhodospirillaceae bacterium]|nr:hypothetical protein [Rhodospirillales bacterium]
MTAMLALVGRTVEPFFAIPIPPGLDQMARDWIAGHVHLGVMVVMPGEALFAEPHWADDFATELGAAWAVPETE